MENTRHMIGKYIVVRTLGQGGEGCVWLARDEDLQRLVAIKEMRGASQDREREKELMREADFLQQLRHPMLPVVYDLLWEDGWYLVMEYVQGMTLGAYIARNGCVQEEQAREWAGQLLDILQYLHTRKTPVIYRDLKPDNIMVCPDGHLKLVDFGAALRKSFGGHRERIMAASPGYAAPEQLGRFAERKGAGEDGTEEDGTEAGREVYADERSDLYAFGKVLYYIVTGALHVALHTGLSADAVRRSGAGDPQMYQRGPLRAVRLRGGDRKGTRRVRQAEKPPAPPAVCQGDREADLADGGIKGSSFPKLQNVV